MRGIDNAALELCNRVATATATGPITPEELYQYIEPELLHHCYLTPLTRATQVAAATTLPAWTVNAFRESLEATIEDAATQFTALHGTPSPPPLPIAPTPAP